MSLTPEQWKEKYEAGMALLKKDLHDVREERDLLRKQLEECRGNRLSR